MEDTGQHHQDPDTVFHLLELPTGVLLYLLDLTPRPARLFLAQTCSALWNLERMSRPRLTSSILIPQSDLCWGFGIITSESQRDELDYICVLMDGRTDVFPCERCLRSHLLTRPRHYTWPCRLRDYPGRYHFAPPAVFLDVQFSYSLVKYLVGCAQRWLDITPWQRERIREFMLPKTVTRWRGYPTDVWKPVSGTVSPKMVVDSYDSVTGEPRYKFIVRVEQKFITYGTWTPDRIPIYDTNYCHHQPARSEDGFWRSYVTSRIRTYQDILDLWHGKLHLVASCERCPSDFELEVSLRQGGGYVAILQQWHDLSAAALPSDWEWGAFEDLLSDRNKSPGVNQLANHDTLSDAFNEMVLWHPEDSAHSFGAVYSDSEDEDAAVYSPLTPWAEDREGHCHTKSGRVPGSVKSLYEKPRPSAIPEGEY